MPDSRRVGKAQIQAIGEPDPDLKELRGADAEYHRLCIDVQEPIVALDQLRLDEMATAVDRLASAIARLRERGT